jgi:hypothetical protein
LAREQHRERERIRAKRSADGPQRQQFIDLHGCMFADERVRKNVKASCGSLREQFAARTCMATPRVTTAASVRKYRC